MSMSATNGRVPSASSAPLVALGPRPDAAGLDRSGNGHTQMLGVVDHLDRVEHLHIAGTAAEMPVQRLGDGLARHPPLAVGQMLDPQHQPRRAEAALHPGRSLEGIGVELALGFGNALQRRDLATGGLGDRQRAGQPRLAVQQHQAAAALALRRASVLQRLDLAGLAQDLQQRLVGLGRDAALFPVEPKADRFHARSRSGGRVGRRKGGADIVVTGRDDVEQRGHDPDGRALGGTA